MANERGLEPLWLGSLLGAFACAVPTSLGELNAQSDSVGVTGSASATTTMVDTDSTSTSSGASSTGPVPDDTTTGPGTGPLPMHAWVMRYDDYQDAMPDFGTTDSGNSGGGGSETGTGIEPNTLVVQISTGPDDCEDPWAGLQCGGQWAMFVLIPPSLQVPGTYALFEELDAGYSMTGALEPGDICSGGGGTLEGEIELTVVSEQEVRGQLSSTNVFEFDGDVAFVALGCG